MKYSYPRLIIAGLKGGSGKTMLSLGLIAAWRQKGLTVVPYKKGPDYIDAGWLSSSAGHPCYNLDAFLISKAKLIQSFRAHFSNADCAVIEGNRGLFDGMDAEGTYSTAELARLLKAPVILIIDCTKSTRTVGAMVLGMQRFDRRVEIRGVVLNRTAGARHERVVKESIEKYCRIPVLGAIPKLNSDFLAERHMGLTPFQEHNGVKNTVSYAAEIAEKYLDTAKILKIALKARQFAGTKSTVRNREPGTRLTQPGLKNSAHGIKIGIIRDSAFQFYYPENFEELAGKGAELVEISALNQQRLPDIHALYIGGGFPETHAITLAGNKAFRKSLKKAVENGLPVYAECGGLMYLGKSLLLDNKTYPMAGIFPVTFSLEKRPQAHGYTVIEINRQTPFYRKGTVLKGHEFHYSKTVRIEKRGGMSFSAKMRRGQGISDKRDGLCYRNTFATYTHVHALGSPEWVDGMVRSATSYRRKRI